MGKKSKEKSGGGLDEFLGKLEVKRAAGGASVAPSVFDVSQAKIGPGRARPCDRLLRIIQVDDSGNDVSTGEYWLDLDADGGVQDWGDLLAVLRRLLGVSVLFFHSSHLPSCPSLTTPVYKLGGWLRVEAPGGVLPAQGPRAPAASSSPSATSTAAAAAAAAPAAAGPLHVPSLAPAAAFFRAVFVGDVAQAQRVLQVHAGELPGAAEQLLAASVSTAGGQRLFAGVPFADAASSLFLVESAAAAAAAQIGDGGIRFNGADGQTLLQVVDQRHQERVPLFRGDNFEYAKMHQWVHSLAAAADNAAAAEPVPPPKEQDGEKKHHHQHHHHHHQHHHHHHQHHHDKNKKGGNDTTKNGNKKKEEEQQNDEQPAPKKKPHSKKKRASKS